MSNFKDLKNINHAYLLVHNEPKVRVKKALELVKIISQNDKIDFNNHPDFFIFQPNDIKYGIHLIREIQKNISLKPYELNQKIVILNDAHQLTKEAQNALLKTLEEPTSNSILILTVNHHENILATISSRCEIYYLHQETTTSTDTVDPQTIETFNQLATYSLVEQFTWIDSVYKTLDIPSLLKLWVIYNRKELRGQIYSKSYTKKKISSLIHNIEQISQTILLLEKTNTNTRLALEVLILKIYPNSL